MRPGPLSFLNHWLNFLNHFPSTPLPFLPICAKSQGKSECIGPQAGTRDRTSHRLFICEKFGDKSELPARAAFSRKYHRRAAGVTGIIPVGSSYANFLKVKVAPGVSKKCPEMGFLESCMEEKNGEIRKRYRPGKNLGKLDCAIGFWINAPRTFVL